MALFKCKMCGGALEVNNETVALCEYCGTRQTLPRLDDERRANLYDRANHFRRNNEFDKAMGIYNQILNEDKTDAEAYWSLVLCRYGIEYVEDPASRKRIPTVNRAQFTSIFDDEDYKSALQYADGVQHGIYEEEAKAINEIQKGILSISQKEEPFDVFICYKETDHNGRRTPDSVLANELYHQLVGEGFKVFFSRITLEDKLGSAYEPYIFAALNSAKVMVVLGTKPEFFQAVWVKNEWSRYLALIKNDARKILIPAYKDMDPYDLPEEFSHLQAQDMSKLGFMQDLIRGIKKITQASAPKTTIVKETVVTGGNTNTAPLLKRVFLFLEDGEWNSADEYCEKVLDLDPECAEAYLGKLMAEMRVKRKADLADCAEPFDEDKNYQKAIRFGNDKFKAMLSGYIDYINTRNENARLEWIYDHAKDAMGLANYHEAAELFESISHYMDSAALWKKCADKAEMIRLEREKQEELERKEAKKRAKRKKIITICITTFVILVGIVWQNVLSPDYNYNKAIGLMEGGFYEEAISIFEELGNYKDSESNMIECKYNQAVEWLEQGYSMEAYRVFVAVDGYKDSAQKANDLYNELKSQSLKTAKDGNSNSVFFGKIEQDNNGANGKDIIEWRVLEVKDGRALVISKYALAGKTYNTTYTDVTWVNSTIRKWLNNDFLNEAFSADEQAMIPAVTVSSDKNPDYDTTPGTATLDKVFLLSVAEADKHLHTFYSRKCEPTEYAKANGVSISSDKYCNWWLRTPGYEQSYAAAVHHSGDFINVGRPVRDKIGVRPAMWIDLSKVN